MYENKLQTFPAGVGSPAQVRGWTAPYQQGSYQPFHPAARPRRNPRRGADLYQQCLAEQKAGVSLNELIQAMRYALATF